MNAKPASPRLTEAAQVELTELMTPIAALEAHTQSVSTETLRDHHHAILTLQIRVAESTNDALLISRLPHEVLGIVFYEACRMLVHWPAKYRPLPTEVWLSHVCRRWRAVALGTPELWTVLRVPIFHTEPAVEAYLQRCGRCMLTVHLGPKLSDLQIEHIFTSVLIPRINQVQELILDTQGYRELLTMFDMLADLAAPGLRRLRITTRDNSGTRCPFAPWQIEIFTHGAPLLSDLRLGSVPVTLPPVPLSVLHFEDHRQIKTPRSDLLNIIRPYAASLTVLHFECGVGVHPGEPESNPIVLPALRKLVVHDDTVSYDCTVFQGISAPALRSLVLQSITQKALWSIHKFMARTRPEQFHDLQSLHYIDCDMDAELDIYLLASTPALRELLVTIDRRQPQLLRLLHNSDKMAVLHGTAPLWPRLRTLMFHVTGQWPRERYVPEVYDVHPDVMLLVELVKLRKAMGCGLDLLRIGDRHARVFYDHLAPALDEAEVEVEVVIDMRGPARDKEGWLTVSMEEDWVGPSRFYGQQYQESLKRSGAKFGVRR